MAIGRDGCADYRGQEPLLHWEHPTTDLTMSDYQHILVAVDFSEQTDSVVQKAVSLARQFKANISFIHVVEYQPVDFSDGFIMPPALDINEQLCELANERMKKLLQSVQLENTASFIEQGSTRHEILRIAKDKAADLIVIGSHGRSGVQLLLGSTANAVLHGAPCDVLAVRIKD